MSAVSPEGTEMVRLVRLIAVESGEGPSSMLSPRDVSRLNWNGVDGESGLPDTVPSTVKAPTPSPTTTWPPPSTLACAPLVASVTNTLLPVTANAANGNATTITTTTTMIVRWPLVNGPSPRPSRP